MHLATVHTNQILLPLLEAGGLCGGPPPPPLVTAEWSAALPATAYPVKRCDVRLRTSDAVDPAFLDTMAVERSHTCDLPICTAVSFKHFLAVLWIHIFIFPNLTGSDII